MRDLRFRSRRTLRRSDLTGGLGRLILVSEEQLMVKTVPGRYGWRP